MQAQLVSGLGVEWQERPPLTLLLPPPLLRPRYALDVNINSLDVLNHKRLLDSARADPTAVSFQLRPVDVVSGSDLAKRPSFGSLDTSHMHVHEVRGRGDAAGWSAQPPLVACLWPTHAVDLQPSCASTHAPVSSLRVAAATAGHHKQLFAAQARRAAAAAPRLWLVAKPAGASRCCRRMCGARTRVQLLAGPACARAACCSAPAC